ncbi:MAG: hypothetical protein ACKN9V_06575 [Pseudomonadota bacterium]
MKTIFTLWPALLTLLYGLPLFAEQSTDFINNSHLNHFYQLFSPRPIADEDSEKSQKEQKNSDPRVRSHQEGILEISGTTITPVRIAVKAGPVAVVGSVELTVRNETNSRWFFRAENIGPETNIWDSRGRAVLVPGKVSCQILHRASLNDYKQAGLTLSADSPIFSFSSGANTEQLRSDFFEDEDICPIGEVPAFTTQKDIERKCKQCLGRVLKTIKEDVNARLSTLSYRIDTPVCTLDSDCYNEDSDWLKGRCILIKDKNGSYLSECRARSKVGGACSGKGSRGLFEYPCDTGLACVKVRSAKGFFDFNSYECRDPKNWKFKGPLKASIR